MTENRFVWGDAEYEIEAASSQAAIAAAERLFCELTSYKKRGPAPNAKITRISKKKAPDARDWPFLHPVLIGPRECWIRIGRKTGWLQVAHDVGECAASGDNQTAAGLLADRAEALAQYRRTLAAAESRARATRKKIVRRETGAPWDAIALLASIDALLRKVPTLRGKVDVMGRLCGITLSRGANGVWVDQYGGEYDLVATKRVSGASCEVK